MTNFADTFSALLEINLGVKPGERLLIFTDIVRQEEQVSPADRDRRSRLHTVTQDLANFASSHYGNTTMVIYPATTASGAEPPYELWEAAMGKAAAKTLQEKGLLERLIQKSAGPEDLARAQEIVMAEKEAVADVVIALANNSTSHTRFRSLINATGGRFASLPNFDPEMFFSSMMVDWAALSGRTANLADLVNSSQWIRMTTPNGTDIKFVKGSRRAAGDDGILTQPGSFGNLPAGEVYLAPMEGLTSGIMVIEYAPTRKLSSPLALRVEEGMVTAIDGDDPYRTQLEKKFEESALNRNIAELGIGTNDRATRPDNILEAEKILGTVHVALGDNSGFGGTVQTPFHEDYVFYHPTLTLTTAEGNEKVLLENGTPKF